MIFLDKVEQKKLVQLVERYAYTGWRQESLISSAGLDEVRPNILIGTVPHEYAERLVTILAQWGNIRNRPAIYWLIDELLEIYEGHLSIVKFLLKILELPTNNDIPFGKYIKYKNNPYLVPIIIAILFILRYATSMWYFTAGLAGIAFIGIYVAYTENSPQSLKNIIEINRDKKESLEVVSLFTIPDEPSQIGEWLLSLAKQENSFIDGTVLVDRSTILYPSDWQND